MRIQRIKKYLLRVVALALVLYAAVSLKMWLVSPADGIQKLANSDLAAFKVQRRAEKSDQYDYGLDSNQKDRGSYEAPKLEDVQKRRSNHPATKLDAVLNFSKVNGKTFIEQQYTNQLLTVQGPFQPGTSIIGNLTYGADNTTRYALFPDEYTNSDRIVNQMRYVPLSVLRSRLRGDLKDKLIVVLSARDASKQRLQQDNCPVQECEFSENYNDMKRADMIVWMQSAMYPSHQRPANQVWVIYQLESPYNSQSYEMFRDQVNYSASYRHDSTLVTPYYKFLPFNNVTRKRQSVNYAEGKTKQVAWFVSNCQARNQRLQYAEELSKYIGVDIYGTCGNRHCPRSQANSCLQMISKDYKFYLAFENSNCRDYITEKFFLNGLHQNVIPIVMGAHPDDYRRAAPDHSYIHVDDFESAKDLALFLHRLDRDDALYNEYFEWKGTGEFVNTFWWCRLCAMAHAVESEKRSMQIPDFESWWRSQQVCIEGSWRVTSTKN